MHKGNNVFIISYIIMNKKLPCIFDYSDYRKFLSDFQAARYSYDKEFTKSNICKLVGLPNTRSFFIDVIKGKDITPTFVERFVSTFSLNSEESQYFRVLVKFNQAINPNERELYFDQLLSLNKVPCKFLSKDVFEYYNCWHNSVIRAIINICDFSGNYGELAKRVFPKITAKQAKESVKLLEKLKLIKKNDNGLYKLTDNSISAPEFIKDDLIKQYQMTCLDNAKQSVLQKDLVHKIISTNTISISMDGYKEIEKRIEKFRNEIRTIVQNDKKEPEKVCQLNIQLFPNLK